MLVVAECWGHDTTKHLCNEREGRTRSGDRLVVRGDHTHNQRFRLQRLSARYPELLERCRHASMGSIVKGLTWYHRSDRRHREASNFFFPLVPHAAVGHTAHDNYGPAGNRPMIISCQSADCTIPQALRFDFFQANKGINDPGHVNRPRYVGQAHRHELLGRPIRFIDYHVTVFDHVAYVPRTRI